MASRTNSQFLAASLTEFLSVWSVGGDACLNLTTRNGLANVQFNCTLGHPGALHSLSPTPSPTSAPPPHRPRHRGPAARERNRQRAARHQEARTAAPASASPSAPSVTGSVTSSSSDAPISVTTSASLPASSPSSAPEATPVSNVKASAASVSKATEEPPCKFKCEQCNYTNVTNKGIMQHIRIKHKISQVDGTHDLEEEIVLKTGTATSKTNDPSVNICKVCKMDTTLCPLSPGCPKEELIKARQHLAALQAEARRRCLLPGSEVTSWPTVYLLS